MKGSIFAGGSITRVYLLTKVTSKQLFPVYDKPGFEVLLGNGQQFGVSLTYAVQNGLAQAFIIGADFIGNVSVAMVLDDNILPDMKKRFKAAVENAQSGKKAIVFGYYVEDSERFHLCY